MIINAILEYNDKGCLVWAENYFGAYARGKTPQEAYQKLPAEVARYLRWSENRDFEGGEVAVRFESKSSLAVDDADSDILFPSERLPMDMTEYIGKKELILRSARDLKTLYLSIPQRNRALVKSRPTFYGRIPQTAVEMTTHVNNTLSYYAAGLGIEHENLPDLVENRAAFFKTIERKGDFLNLGVCTASDGESWTPKKLMRRLLFHDIIHARALYRKAVSFWGKERILNPFFF
ncbi:MAG: hypothetical protein Q4C01_02210 [Clostridia bacterium]|nr:hypothetical protein [Clostridia bacterium]